MILRGGAALAAALASFGACAADTPKVEDNSFLIEEAYNQEAGVVQHINAFLYDRRTKEWAYGFTQEWPLGGMQHQLSYTVPVLRAGDPLATGLGDVAIHYRYQLVRNDRLAMAPRVSVVAPTGRWRKGLGAGATGVQLELPVSVELGEAFVTHLNAGATRTPRSRAPDGTRASTTSTNAGASLVWLATPVFNVMLEALTTRDEEVEEGGGTRRARTTLVSPGFRYAINHAGGAQTVVGAALPRGVGSSRTRGAFLYFSFEHPFL